MTLHPLQSSCPKSSWGLGDSLLSTCMGQGGARGIQVPTDQSKGDPPIYQHHSLGLFLSNQGLGPRN